MILLERALSFFVHMKGAAIRDSSVDGSERDFEKWIEANLKQREIENYASLSALLVERRMLMD